MNLPVFSPRQTGVIVLLAAALLLLYAWRADFWRSPSPPAALPPNLVFVEITGAAPRPGVHAFDHPPTLLEALKTAGVAAIALPANPTLASGSLIDIDQAGGHRLGRMAGARLLTLGLALNLNEATKEDLEALPGIGPALAGRIIAHRQQHGPFTRIDDLGQVPGIGPKNLENLRPYLSLDSRQP
jgi:competence protein ComEA